VSDPMAAWVARVTGKTMPVGPDGRTITVLAVQTVHQLDGVVFADVLADDGDSYTVREPVDNGERATWQSLGYGDVVPVDPEWIKWAQRVSSHHITPWPPNG
jgi:hypothetical protein